MKAMTAAAQTIIGEFYAAIHDNEDQGADDNAVKHEADNGAERV